MAKKMLLTVCMGIVFAAASGMTASAENQFLGGGTLLKLAPADTKGKVYDRNCNRGSISGNSKEATVEKGSIWLSSGDVMRRAAGDKTERLDSIIGCNEYDGTLTRQIFQYDSDGHIVWRENAFNYGYGWEPAEVYEYEWSDEGLVLSESCIGYGAGMKYTYEYNDEGLGIEKVTYYYVDGEWVEAEKGEYIYDDDANIIDETSYFFQNGEWVPSVHNMATWTTLHRQTSFEGYYWNGQEWVGQAKENYRYFGDYNDRLTFLERYIWLQNEKKFRVADRITQVFNDNALLTYQDRLFWNEERQDWSGNYPSFGTDICTNLKTEISYDDKFRMLCDATCYDYEGTGEWTMVGKMEYTYTDLDNGDYDMLMDGWLYFYPENTAVNDQKRYARYNASGQNMWMVQQLRDTSDSEFRNDYEEKTEYDKMGNILRYASWNWNGLHRIPDIRNINSYNEYGLDTEAYNYVCIPGYSQLRDSLVGTPEWDESDEEGWENITHFEYKYEKDCRISKFGWIWSDGEWLANFGNDVVYDFAVSISQILMPGEVDDPFKILTATNYVGDGFTEFIGTTNTYHYSALTPSGVAEVAGNGCSFDGKWLRIAGETISQTTVSDMNGRTVATFSGNEVYLGNLTPGIYLAHIDTAGVSRTVKIALR